MTQLIFDKYHVYNKTYRIELIKFGDNINHLFLCFSFQIL
mgnify:CR=1 FL=1